VSVDAKKNSCIPVVTEALLQLFVRFPSVMQVVTGSTSVEEYITHLLDEAGADYDRSSGSASSEVSSDMVSRLSLALVSRFLVNKVQLAASRDCQDMGLAVNESSASASASASEAGAGAGKSEGWGSKLSSTSAAAGDADAVPVAHYQRMLRTPLAAFESTRSKQPRGRFAVQPSSSSSSASTPLSSPTSPFPSSPMLCLGGPEAASAGSSQSAADCFLSRIAAQLGDDIAASLKAAARDPSAVDITGASSSPQSHRRRSAVLRPGRANRIWQALTMLEAAVFHCPENQVMIPADS
jgi:hypothetical protein